MLGGGGGYVRGTATVDRYTQECCFIPQPPPVRERLTGDITEVSSHIFFDTSKWTVIGRIEPNVAFLLGSSMKVHLGAGFPLPRDDTLCGARDLLLSEGGRVTDWRRRLFDTQHAFFCQ